MVGLVLISNSWELDTGLWNQQIPLSGVPIANSHHGRNVVQPSFPQPGHLLPLIPLPPQLPQVDIFVDILVRCEVFVRMHGMTNAGCLR